eukprot:8884754-Lingulodinium_polyedra.AAC.1
MAGGAVVEDIARHWNAEGAACPRCKRVPETQEHRFWQCPCLDGDRASGRPRRSRAHQPRPRARP